MSIAYLTAGQREALESFMQVGAANVAASQVPGHQAQKVNFNAMVQNADTPDAVAYTAESGFFRDTTPGSLENTGDPLNVAVMGGYLSVETPEGVHYTLNGQGRMNVDGEWVNAMGHPYLDEGGAPIIVPEGMMVAEDGTITDRAGNLITRLGVTRFDDEQRLTAIGGSLFQAPDDMARIPAENAQVIHKNIMKSNVSVVQTLADVNYAQIAYQGNLELSKSYFKLDEQAIDSLVKI